MIISNPLFQPLELPCGAVIKNRFQKSALSEALSSPNHKPTPQLITLYRRWAEGGSGLILTGNVMVDRYALGEPRNVVVEDERDIELLKQWAKAGKQKGSHFWMQINHPGKQSPKFLSKEPVSPSPIPLKGDVGKFFNKPKELTSTEIYEIIKRFGETARIAKKAGFTGVQIHAAHGYLISQFLSPYHNQRKDEWGGSLQNRMNFLINIFSEIRQQVGSSFPIGIKLNSADFQRGGFSEEESSQVIRNLSKLHVDLIEISGGNYENPEMFNRNASVSTKKREAYFIDFAEKIRELTSTPIVVTGGFRSEEGITEAINNNRVDMVGMGRPFIINPDIPKQILNKSYTPFEMKKIRTYFSPLDTTGFSDLYWFEYQMKRLGSGKEPNLKYSGLSLLFRTILTQGVHIFQQRRAK